MIHQTIGTPTELYVDLIPETYVMELNECDFSILAKITNIGIDSRLQAITPCFLTSVFSNKCKLKFDKDSLICLLNRLLDYSEFGECWDRELLDKEEQERALDLRQSILFTIGIEEI